MKALLPLPCGAAVGEPRVHKGLRSLRRPSEVLRRHFRVLLPSVSELLDPPPPPTPRPNTPLLRVGGGTELASLLADLANDACPALHRVTAIRRLDDACVNRCVTNAAQSRGIIGCMRLLRSLDAPRGGVGAGGGGSRCKARDVMERSRRRLSSRSVAKLDVGVEEKCVFSLCCCHACAKSPPCLFARLI